MVSSTSGLISRLACGLLLVSGAQLFAQDSPASAPDAAPGPEAIQPAQAPQEPVTGEEVNPDKRVFGVLPNYRTADSNATYTPITSKQKLTIATKDTLDYPLMLLGAGLAGLGQITNQHPEFGQGLKGYFSRYGTSYTDQFIGNYMTEGFLPILFHEDPRYFYIGPSRGGLWYRAGYAATRIFVTKTDTGHNTFNFSEVVGNSISAGVGNAYYPGERTLGDNFARLATQLATDAISQVLKEFWPDVKRKYFSHHSHDVP